MKTANDPRHQKRVRIMKDLFAWDFQKEKKEATLESTQIIEHLEEIDDKIKKVAPEWPINQINKLDLAILRLAVFELIIVKEAPFKTVVDEAVELGKEYGNESSPGFINGVLGSVIKTNKLDKEKTDV
ncbi:MAG: transcription antitermination factor NusB [Candidatus Daviesbacteria bacterium]|nr:transcription antitermination factor NusB [Candidatus Daviesbacteria bacterium]